MTLNPLAGVPCGQRGRGGGHEAAACTKSLFLVICTFDTWHTRVRVRASGVYNADYFTGTWITDQLSEGCKLVDAINTKRTW